MNMTPEQEQHLLDRLETVENALERELKESKEQRLYTSKKIECFHNKYADFLDLLIEREQNRKKLSQAIIEKSMTGAIWAVLVFLAVASWEWAKNHIR